MGRAAAAARRRGAAGAVESVCPSPGTACRGNSAQTHGPYCERKIH